MELIINQNLLFRYTLIKESQISKMTKTQFHFLKIDEIKFRKCKIHIQKQLKHLATWQQ